MLTPAQVGKPPASASWKADTTARRAVSPRGARRSQERAASRDRIIAGSGGGARRGGGDAHICALPLRLHGVGDRMGGHRDAFAMDLHLLYADLCPGVIPVALAHRAVARKLPPPPTARDLSIPYPSLLPCTSLTEPGTAPPPIHSIDTRRTTPWLCMLTLEPIGNILPPEPRSVLTHAGVTCHGGATRTKTFFGKSRSGSACHS